MRVTEKLLEKAKEQYPQKDWQYDVANGDTKLGYQEWLRHRIEANSLIPSEESNQ